MRLAVAALLSVGVFSGCDCASKACPSALFPCQLGCIPSDGTCCSDGSFCPSGTVCVPSGTAFTCTASAANSACVLGQRHCGAECIETKAPCCVGGDCTDAREKPSGAGICPDQAGFKLCGQCVGEGGGCQGICRYCSSNSFCGGDICGDVQCRGASGSDLNPAGCGDVSGGGGGGGSCSDSQHRLASCPDGSKKCCSVNQVCCRDSSSGGAIGCQFSGFCQ